MRRFVVTISIAGLTVVAASTAIAASSSLSPVALSHARTIKTEISARYVRGPKLIVTEASSTGVIESFLLLTADFLGLRVVPADNGIHYAICPVRATCPYPGPRAARPASALRPSPAGARARAANVPRDLGDGRLRLASRHRDYVFFLVERDELAGSRHGCAGEGAGRQSCAAPAASAAADVDEITRPRLFVPLGLEPTPSGRESLGAAPLWPEAR